MMENFWSVATLSGLKQNQSSLKDFADPWMHGRARVRWCIRAGDSGKTFQDKRERRGVQGFLPSEYNITFSTGQWGWREKDGAWLSRQSLVTYNKTTWVTCRFHLAEWPSCHISKDSGAGLAKWYGWVMGCCPHPDTVGRLRGCCQPPPPSVPYPHPVPADLSFLWTQHIHPLSLMLTYVRHLCPFVSLSHHVTDLQKDKTIKITENNKSAHKSTGIQSPL